MAERVTVPAGCPRTLGWDTPTPPSQAGDRFSPRSIGHLGYTGCSLWIDLDREITVVLLTNRVVFGADNRLIRNFRPAIHDAVMEAIVR
jgi:CubicO group peptidase (beta-lactamase class C family)